MEGQGAARQRLMTVGDDRIAPGAALRAISWWRHTGLATCVALGAAGAIPLAAGGQRGAVRQPGISYLAIDLRSNTRVAAERPDLTDVPIRPGSVAKIAALAAALEVGVIDERTRILCTREVAVAGHQLRCTHPDLHRPLGPTEALAHSCNVYFATVAARLPRAALDRTLNDLGLPPSDPGLPVAAAALGIEGLRAPPRQLLDMLVRVASDPNALPWKPSTLALVRDGLRGAAEYGTASALAERGVSAMAKTGTTEARGLSQGVVVGVTPASRPTLGFVLVVSGGAGMDAAALVAERLAPANAAQKGEVAAAPTTRETMIRVGVAGEQGGYSVRPMPLEDYVARVVAGEAAPSSQPASLEALAITVRSFALANRGRHKAEGFDLCDLTHCQVLRRATPATTRAAAATQGRVLLDRGKPAHVFYTASCGGYSERPSLVWPGAIDPPYLLSRPDDACAGGPLWHADLPVADLMRALRAGGFRGDSLRDVRVVSRSASGRVSWLHLDGFTPHEISGEDLRTLVGRTLGWQHIRSTSFDIIRTGAGFHVEGRGAGHGVGLCVVGSSALAVRGTSAEAILARYFPGLAISAPTTSPSADSSPLTIVLPASERSELAAVRDVADRALSTLSNRLGVPAPAGITLRFHPTVESYADIAILELREGSFDFLDNYEAKRHGQQRLFPSATILAGKRAPRA